MSSLPTLHDVYVLIIYNPVDFAVFTFDTKTNICVSVLGADERWIGKHNDEVFGQMFTMLKYRDESVNDNVYPRVEEILLPGFNKET